MADNRTTLLDEDGEPSDWIELRNPDPNPIRLGGWFLTDDPALPTKWRFPDRTLASGGHLVVFASGKDRTAPAPSFLHTNFRLDGGGDYLALVEPDGHSIATEFQPAYPPQYPDISYGTPVSVGPHNLLANSPVAVLVPTNAASLSSGWAHPDALPDNRWKTLHGLGLGFDATPAGPASGTNIALSGTVAQSSVGFGFGPEFAIDGDPDSFTHTTSDDNDSTWSLDLGGTFELSRILLRNRTSCCGSRLRDITVTLLGADGATTVWSSGLLNPENILGAPDVITIDFAELNLDAPLARIVRVHRTADPDLSGSGGTGNSDEGSVLSLGEVEVYGVTSISFAPFIRSDIADMMRGKTASAFVRIPFVLDAPETLRALALRLRYSDGIILHLNGQPVASRNAPAAPTWDSTATGSRSKTESLVFESIDLLASRALLRPGTNWLAFQILSAGAADTDLLLDAELVPDLGESAQPFAAYLERPTPGAANNVGWNLGRVADTRFSVDRGFQSAPFDLAITTATPEATLRYTLDGSLPDASNGTNYAGPIRIARTTTVRAVALRPNFRPSDVDTQTYLFPGDAVAQPPKPPGFPTSWAGVAGDYAMDPRITQAAAYTNRMIESLQSLPSLSIVTAADNLWGTTRGLYANPERNGVTWERPVSLEWLDPSGADTFQIDCGLRLQGGYFRQRGVTRKHSLRLLFKGEYGPGHLVRDLFHEFGAAREFDSLVLRAGANDGYAWDAARDTEQFIRDEFGHQLLRAMGQVSGHGRFVHVYLNGLYWGVYHLAERPAEDFSATYFGGQAEDWDAINAGDVKNGSLDAWNAFLAAMRTVATAADYQKLQGRNPDGSPNPAFTAHFDASNYIDYMLVNIWGGNWDWPNKNFWFAHDRTGRVPGFKFYLWDFENTMGNNLDRSPLNMVSPRSGVTAAWVAEPHDRLKKASADYRLEFADHVQRHFFNAGALSADALVNRYRDLATRIEPAIISETARWGDDHWNPPQDLTDWQRERDWLLHTYLPQRTAVVLAQLRNAGLYPRTAAPTLTPFSGPIAPDAAVIVTATASEIFFTTNGIDPRSPGGAAHPSANRMLLSSIPGTTTRTNGIAIPNEVTRLMIRSREGNDWSALVDAIYTPDVVPASPSNLVISEFNYRPANPTNTTETAVSTDRDDYEFVELLNIGPKAVDLAGARFQAGILFSFAPGTRLSPGERITVVSRIDAFRARYGPDARIAGAYDGRLANDGEEITLLDASGQVLRQFLYHDRAPWPSSANGDGYSLVLGQPGTNPDHAQARNWRSSVNRNGTPGGTDTTPFTGSALADSDGNGQADILDYAFGTVRGSPATGALARIETTDTASGPEPQFLISFPRNPAADDTRVMLEISDAVGGPWVDAGSVMEPAGEDRSMPGLAWLTYRDPNPVRGQSARFVRLSVLAGR